VHFPLRNGRGEGQREFEELEGGEGFQLVNEGQVAAMMKKASSTAPGEDLISTNILKVFWEWDWQIFTGLVRPAFDSDTTQNCGKRHEEWLSPRPTSLTTRRLELTG